MAVFTVTWEIEVEAESHQDAARKALEVQRDPCSSATCFDVFGANAAKHVDLNDTNGN